MSGESDSPFISTQELACILMKNQYDEMHDVLEWASENVESIGHWGGDDEMWVLCPKKNSHQKIYAPTLYQALHTVWEKRDE